MKLWPWPTRVAPSWSEAVTLTYLCHKSWLITVVLILISKSWSTSWCRVVALTCSWVALKMEMQLVRVNRLVTNPNIITTLVTFDPAAACSLDGELWPWPTCRRLILACSCSWWGEVLYCTQMPFSKLRRMGNVLGFTIIMLEKSTCTSFITPTSRDQSAGAIQKQGRRNRNKEKRPWIMKSDGNCWITWRQDDRFCQSEEEKMKALCHTKG